MKGFKVVKFTQECPVCNGYGTITRTAEMEMFAAICHICHGKGCIENNVKYKKFTKRKVNEKLNRIFPERCPVITGLEYNTGMSYQEWLEGKPFPKRSEPRKTCCPTQWKRWTDPANCPEWVECENYWEKKSYDYCDFYKDKQKCWERYDAEMEMDL